MKRILIPIIVFFALPFSDLESKEINCNSPVWKKRDICKGKVSTKNTFVYLGKEYESLNDIQDDIQDREKYEFKNKTYISSKKCEEGENMIWYFQKRFLRSTQVFEKGCLTPDKAKIFALELQLQRARSGGGGGGGNYQNTYVDGYNRQRQHYQQLDNFNRTGSFNPPPTFNFNTSPY